MQTFAFAMLVVVDAESLRRDPNPASTCVRTVAEEIRANLESFNAVQMVTVTRVRGPQRPSVHVPSISPRSPSEDDQ